MITVKVLDFIFLTFAMFPLIFATLQKDESGCVQRRNTTENNTLLNVCDLNVIEFYRFSIFPLIFQTNQQKMFV
jgi:hypothetical protein